MAVVKFAEYREYLRNRQEANNAIMALLAGSQLANHVLQLTQGSDTQLSSIFPTVPHIKRFNLRTDRARQLLTDAEEHLCAMAVPYVLAIHEDLVITMLRMLARDGHITMRRVRDIRSHNMHSALEGATGRSLPAGPILQFHLLRLMRNCLIHAAGLADQALIAHSSAMDVTTVQNWEKLTGRTLAGSVALGRKVSFQQGEMVACLAVTKHIAEQCNSALVARISRKTWADYVVCDYKNSGGSVNSSDCLRKVKGIARFNYGALQLKEPELQDAINRL